MTDQNNTTQNPNLDGGIDIPVRIAQQIDETDDMIKRLQQEERETADMIRQYEERYSQEPAYIKYADAPRPHVVEAPIKTKNDEDDSSWWRRQVSVNMPPRHRYTERAVSKNVTDQEKNWAAIAHATSILTLVLLLTTGFGVMLSLLVPLGIYLYHRNRSEYVAFHALQAFTMQTVGTVGAGLLFVVGLSTLLFLIVVTAITIVGIPIAIALSFVLVGLIFFVASMPVAMVIYGCIAAYAASQGRNYRYPYVADWVDDQLNNGFIGVHI